jgi:MFS family permease
MTSAVAPLRYGSFRTLWLASMLSAFGTFIQSLSSSQLMLDLTGSNTWVGMMVASTSLPLLFFALAAGALADMFDRAKLMILAQAIMGGSALAMAILTWTGVITPALLLGLGFVLGTGVALNLPTWQALLPDMVPRGRSPQLSPSNPLRSTSLVPSDRLLAVSSTPCSGRRSASASTL